MHVNVELINLALTIHEAEAQALLQRTVHFLLQLGQIIEADILLLGHLNDDVLLGSGARERQERATYIQAFHNFNFKSNLKQQIYAFSIYIREKKLKLF